VDPRVAQLVGGGQLWEPCSATDIRRWIHAMDDPNPIHWNQELARQSKFGGIVAPQSFVVCMDYGHGVHPACVGRFAGPTMFSSGDTVHTNQHGALVAKERSTSIRHLAAEAERRGFFANQLQPIRRWTRDELEQIAKTRTNWLLSNRLGVSPHFEEVEVGDQLRAA
jgi:hypothetical protein